MDKSKSNITEPENTVSAYISKDIETLFERGRKSAENEFYAMLNSGNYTVPYDRKKSYRTIANYQQFLYSLANETERFTCALDYPEFEVWKDTTNNKYYWLEHECRSICEVSCIAILIYSVNNEPDDDDNRLIGMFDCDICGEMVNDEEIAYMWFKKI